LKNSFESTTEEFGSDRIGNLLESYRPWSRVFVRQFLYGQIGRRIDESDIIQNAWIDVIRKLDQFQGKTEAEFFVWLRKILQNNMKNVLRDNMADKRDIRKETELATDIGESVSLHWWEPVAPGSSPSNRMIRGESALSLAAAIEDLPDAQRLAIELRHLQGLKLMAVANELDRTPDAVVSLLRRAMKKLATAVGHEN
jgi:RNA polymerase sigma-70 factor (ECF subfamily)